LLSYGQGKGWLRSIKRKKCSYTQGALQLFRALLLNVQCGGHLDGWEKEKRF
jgi:hypothetical protein